MTNAANTIKTGEDGNVFAAGLDKAEKMVSSAVDNAKDAASYVAQTMSDAGSTVQEKAHEATLAVGVGMKSLAGTIRENAPRDGVLGTASTAVADTLETGGRYLQNESLRGMTEDVANLIRRNPIPSVLVGVGLGFMLAKLTTRSNHGH